MALARTETELAIVDWAGGGDPEYLLRPSPDAEPFHRALAERRLILRVCRECERARYPHAPACPYCGSTEFEWREIPPQGSVVSWARSHLDLVPEFKPPYIVLCVQLEAGPCLIGRLREDDPEREPRIGDPVTVVAERWPSGSCVAAFVLGGAPGGAAPNAA